ARGEVVTGRVVKRAARRAFLELGAGRVLLGEALGALAVLAEVERIVARIDLEPRRDLAVPGFEAAGIGLVATVVHLLRAVPAAVRGVLGPVGQSRDARGQRGGRGKSILLIVARGDVGAEGARGKRATVAAAVAAAITAAITAAVGVIAAIAATV